MSRPRSQVSLVDKLVRHSSAKDWSYAGLKFFEASFVAGFEDSTGCKQSGTLHEFPDITAGEVC